MFKHFQSKSPAKAAGEDLYAAAAKQARSEPLYAALGAPDTVEGRFELLTLHVILLIDRLHETTEAGSAARQTLFDVYVSNLDGALREMGVGDLAVGKRMRKLGEAFYGRASAYAEAFQALPETAALEAVITRTVFEDAADAQPTGLAAYIARCRAALALGDLNALLSGRPAWAAP